MYICTHALTHTHAHMHARTHTHARTSRGSSCSSNLVRTPIRDGLLRYWRYARPHAFMQSCCRLARHLEKWLNPLSSCIHLVTSCLFVLIGTSCDGTCKKIEANVCILDAPGETIELYSHPFVQQAKKVRQKIKGNAS